jgi:hypothetical protein
MALSAQGKDLDEIFRSTAGMIFRPVFYDLTTSKDNLFTYNHYQKQVVEISTTFLFYHTHVLVFCAYQLLILVSGYCCSLSSIVQQFFV